MFKSPHGDKTRVNPNRVYNQYIHVGYIAYDYTELKNTSQPKNTPVKNLPSSDDPQQIHLKLAMDGEAREAFEQAATEAPCLQMTHLCRLGHAKSEVYRSTVQLMGIFTSLILGNDVQQFESNHRGSQ
jgi:hypothetical protein